VIIKIVMMVLIAHRTVVIEKLENVYINFVILSVVMETDAQPTDVLKKDVNTLLFCVMMEMLVQLIFATVELESVCTD
jgi:hypothetical protein